MKHRMALTMTALALAACAGDKNRPPPKEPVSTTTVTTSAALPMPETEPASPGSTEPDLRDPRSAAPNAAASGVTEKDRELATKIRQHLARKHELSGVPWNRVQIIAADGHVTIDGIVPTLAEASEIEQAVREVKGVTAVTNEIHLPGRAR